ncbi:hypothetical protein A3G55_01370 [Candidatus Giovannonibacteria bacterium RIFCSPLOWO2_12_FULL_44_25]|uniref:Uncharacterized protein n=3 Tax=Parcubacteria group TaxID=1794811 RepID=A0A837IQT7_9BACT|nr:MAG: hypothetical protein UW15_C0010G0003 [Parcubacteria group bacterium GW2011_GWC1_44_10]KKT60099.1 MAG: hypothetical protein UW53_C0003G0010 [Candidatus Giovannonibacteria bacterium GW2011_GWA1_44_25]KKU12695.1 MAG: hypothetical protein UX18_C0014G0013 [Candidatus Azambacteria bacterium GW2011_GWC2_45_7b]KKU29946.1 MAG: hypothetical protein UX43_C0003G0039 [Candidatus Giovannonibacteria bacterium GW2011_GWB1_46_20]OGF49304.1 MAG: hypothetical protein A2120_03205 [Candidatus Giovannonibact
MSPLSNKKPIFVLSFAVLSLAALGVLIWMLYQKISEVSAVVAEAEAKMAFLEKSEREFSVAESGVKDYEKEINLLESAFLNESKFVDFLKLLEGMSKKSGVGFSAKSAKIPAAKGEEAALSFELSGDFGSVVNFIALLDKIPYSGIAESVNVAPKTTRINYLIFNFDL